MRVLFIILLVCTGIFGCGDECELGRSRCVDESHIERCEEGYDPYEPPHWEEAECFSDYYESPYCVVAPTGEAYCAAETEPRPDLCPAPALPNGEYEWTCDGTARIVGCIDGLVGLSRTCGTGACASAPDVPYTFCSILPEADPLCGDQVWSNCADATTRIECLGGYRVEQDECTSGGGCLTGTRTGPNGTLMVGLCALSTELDPACVEEDVSGQTGYCEAGVAINCYLGYPIMREECRGECFDHSYWSECLGESGPVEGWQYGNPPDCDDGFDNDYDGLTDYPDDPGCAAPCCGSG